MNYLELEKQVKSVDFESSKLLDVISSIGKCTSEDIINLERLASLAAKLAYGNNRPEYISIQMYNLIAWCDHLNDGKWQSQFVKAVLKRPLISPFDGK